MYERENLRELKRENRELRHDLNAVSARLQAETGRAERAVKSAAEAWSFARVAIRTGRPPTRGRSRSTEDDPAA